MLNKEQNISVKMILKTNTRMKVVFYYIPGILKCVVHIRWTRLFALLCSFSTGHLVNVVKYVNSAKPLQYCNVIYPKELDNDFRIR